MTICLTCGLMLSPRWPIARAMQVPDQPFTNFAQSKYLLDSAARQINSARIDSNYGSIRGSMRVRARPFA